LYWQENNQLAWRFNLKAIHAKIDNTNAALESNNVFEKPTLFLRGENSNYILREDEPLIRKYFPNAEIKTTPQAGHWIHADNPQWFLEICLSFL
jgi:esterase